MGQSNSLVKTQVSITDSCYLISSSVSDHCKRQSDGSVTTEAAEPCQVPVYRCLLAGCTRQNRRGMNKMGEFAFYFFEYGKLCMGWRKERKEKTEEREYEMMNRVHHGEFRTGSSFAWEVRTNIAPSYPGGSTHEKSLIENTRHSELPHLPTYANTLH